MYPHWKASFFTLWTGQALSILTSSLSQFALIWYLTEQTGSAAVLSLSMLCAMLPQGILSLFTGAFADRFDRRYIMVIADGAIGLVSLGLALWAFLGELTLWPILVALALRSVGSAFHNPCLQAVTPLIAPPDTLAKCAGWSQGVQTISLLVAPALAAVLYELVPLPWIILMDTAGAALACLAIWAARLPALKVGVQGQKLRLWADSVEGFRVLRSKRWLWELTLVCAVFSVAFMPIGALFPLMCMGHFGTGTAGAAAAETAFSLGMLLGSIILGIWGGTKDKIVTMVGAVFGLGAVLVVCGFLPSTAFLPFLGLTLLMALCAPFFNSLFMALLQEKVEPEYLGRILGLTGAVMTLASPIGLVATALLGDRTGVPVWFLVSGVVSILCALACLLLPSIRNCDRT